MTQPVNIIELKRPANDRIQKHPGRIGGPETLFGSSRYPSVDLLCISLMQHPAVVLIYRIGTHPEITVIHHLLLIRMRYIFWINLAASRYQNQKTEKNQVRSFHLQSPLADQI